MHFYNRLGLCSGERGFQLAGGDVVELLQDLNAQSSGIMTPKVDEHLGGGRLFVSCIVVEGLNQDIAVNEGHRHGD